MGLRVEGSKLVNWTVVVYAGQRAVGFGHWQISYDRREQE